MRFICILSFFSIITVMTVGCGEKVPDGFPEVFPCTIKVVDGGTPIDGCGVVLKGQNGAVYASGGATDASGVATVGTSQGSFHKKGVPAGEYKVVLSKAAAVSGGLTEEQARAMDPDQRRAHMEKMATEQAKAVSVVPDILSDPQKTPLLLTVKEGDNTLDIDLALHRK